MATDVILVKSALRALLEEKELHVDSVRNNHVKEVGKRILELVEKAEVELTFAEFCKKLTTDIRGTFRSSTACLHLPPKGEVMVYVSSFKAIEIAWTLESLSFCH